MCIRYILFCSVLLAACSQASRDKNRSFREMQVQIIDHKILNVPSASGIEVSGKRTFIFGDNSPYVYIGDQNFNQFETIALIENATLIDGVMPKKIKLDIEACCLINQLDKYYVLAIGSGSAKNRYQAFLVDEKQQVTSFSLAKLYQAYLQFSGLDSEELNIEGLASDGTYLYFFNRGVNYIFRVACSDFWKYIEEDKLPKIHALLVKWKADDDQRIGFSGVAYSEQRKSFLFTASIENTTNWVNDGEIGGSYLGELKLDESFTSYSTQTTPLLNKEGDLRKVKLESIGILKDGKDKIKVVVVTDSDGGDSEIYTLIISGL